MKPYQSEPPPRLLMKPLPPPEFIRQHIIREVDEAMVRLRESVLDAAWCGQAANTTAYGDTDAVDFHKLNEEVEATEKHARRAKTILAEIRGLRQAESIIRRARENVDAPATR